MLLLSKSFHKHNIAWKKGKRYLISGGGTRSSKTFSILQMLLLMAENKNIRITIVGQDVPHLRRGVLADMKVICAQFGYEFNDYFNKVESHFRHGKGDIYFTSFDTIGKAHGGANDIVYLNEANFIKYEIAEQVMMRAARIIIDFNPIAEFWAHTELLAKQSDNCEVVHSTFEDNDFLAPEIVNAIKAKKGDGTSNWWRVYGLGLIGFSDSVIFRDCKAENADKFPQDGCLLYIDPAFSPTGHDFTACCLASLDSVNDQLCVKGYAWRNAWNRLCADGTQYNPDSEIGKIIRDNSVEEIIVETNSIGELPVNILSQSGRYTRGIIHTATSGSKHSRIMAAATIANDLILCFDGTEANDEFNRQVRNYTIDAEYRDAPDALAGAISCLPPLAELFDKALSGKANYSL